MQSPTSDRKDVLIDFEVAAFLERPSPRVLAAQAGSMAWAVATNRDWASRELVETWFASVLERMELGDDQSLWAIWRACLARRPSSRWRLRQR
jgi:hypothetical protein